MAIKETHTMHNKVYTQMAASPVVVNNNETREAALKLLDAFQSNQALMKDTHSILVKYYNEVVRDHVLIIEKQLQDGLVYLTDFKVENKNKIDLSGTIAVLRLLSDTLQRYATVVDKVKPPVKPLKLTKRHKNVEALLALCKAASPYEATISRRILWILEHSVTINTSFLQLSASDIVAKVKYALAAHHYYSCGDYRAALTCWESTEADPPEFINECKLVFNSNNKQYVECTNHPDTTADAMKQLHDVLTRVYTSDAMKRLQDIQTRVHTRSPSSSSSADSSTLSFAPAGGNAIVGLSL